MASKKDSDKNKRLIQALLRERDERNLNATREEGSRTELDQRREQNIADQQLRDNELQRADEERQKVLDEQKKQRESDLLQRAEEVRRKERQAASKKSTRSESLFKLFVAKKNIYAIKIQVYFCHMIQISLTPPGEIARFFQHFKDKLFTGPTMIYPKFPINYLNESRSPADRKAMVSLIDAQDENGFTALHWAVFGREVKQIETLLANGASTEVKTFVNKHKPIDKLQPLANYRASEVHELFRLYKDKRSISNSESNKTTEMIIIQQQNETEVERDPLPFPFLELPIEIQLIILEQLSIGKMLTVRCVCKYLQTLRLSNAHVTSLPDMGIFKFLNQPDRWGCQKSMCELTVMATPTVFHFGLIIGQYYSAPKMIGADLDLVVNEMTERIERFAKEDKKFQYDTDKLKNFLVNSSRNENHRIYILERRVYSAVHNIYVELDSSFGVGIEFISPGDPEPPNDDDW